MTSPVIAPRLVHEWKGINLQGQSKDVCLYRFDDSQWGFSENGRQGTVRTFSSQLYNPAYAEGVVRLFQNSIRENLQRWPVNGACFLPKFVREISAKSDVRIALFGKIHVLEDRKGQVDVAWGISDPSDPHTHLIARDPTDMTEAFLKHAPEQNKPHLKEKVRHGKREMKPAKDHYEMDEYLKHFHVEITRDSLAKISNVSLSCVSVLNPELSLTEHDWSLTLVSSPNCSDGFFSELFFRGVLGHAMLAYEGMNQMKPVLGYIHFSSTPRQKNPQLKEGKEGLVERFELHHPLKTINGPSWRRSRELIENMLAFVDTQKGKPRPFAFLGGWFSRHLSEFTTIFRNEASSGISTSSEIRARAEQIMVTPQRAEGSDRKYEYPLSCLDGMTNIAEYAGVIFYGHTAATRPLRKITQVLEFPTYQIPEGLHRHIPTRRSLFDNGRPDVVNGMLSACVILTPSDCPPQDCGNWGLQIALEKQWAKYREIERASSVSTDLT